jgi:hypothetical protein
LYADLAEIRTWLVIWHIACSHVYGNELDPTFFRGP